MKSFFKKLAFIMALAMVVSLAAPAAQASAAEKKEFTYAYQLGGKVTKLNMEAGDKIDLKFVGVKDYKEFAADAFVWSSLDEEVATVDKNGVVTAVADGTTFVQLKIKGSNYTSKAVEVVVGEELAPVVLGTAKDDTFAEYELAAGTSVDLDFFGVPNYNKTNYSVVWISNAPEVAVVDAAGLVAAVAEGTATVTAAIVNNITGDTLTVVPVVFTVVPAAEVEPTVAPEVTETPEPTVAPVDPVEFSFEANMYSDNKAVLTFNDTTIKAADVAKSLEFFYYAAPGYAVTVPLFESVKDNGEGSVIVDMYDSFLFQDGVGYGFKYNDYTAEFTCVIGSVTTAELKIKDVNGYLVEVSDKSYDFNVALYNEKGQDITTSALNQGVYVEYTVADDEDGKFYPTSESSIKFDEPATAKVTVTVLKNNNDGEPYKLIDGAEYYVVAKAATPYAIEFNAAPAWTIVASGTSESVNWTKDLNHKIAVGDVNKELLVKIADNKGGEIGTNEYYYKDGVLGNVYENGTFRLESTNVSRLYVTDDGTLMPNAQGDVNVLVYYVTINDDGQTVEKLVAAIKLYVSPARSVGSVTVDVPTKTLSTKNVNGSNSTKVTVNVLDSLNEKAGVQNVEVTLECTTKDTDLKNGATKFFTKETLNVKEGKVEFTLTASDATVPEAGKSQVYYFKVTVGNQTKNFSVTVKSPASTTVFSKYALIFGSAKVEDCATVGDIQLSVGLAGLSNNVAAAQLDIAGAKGKIENAEENKCYYVVTKDGSDITDKATVAATNGTLYIDVTNTKNVDYKVTSAATADSLKVVDLTHGAGKYSVAIYEAKKEATTGKLYFKLLSGAKDEYTVEYKFDKTSYVGKNSPEFAERDVEEAVKNCFEFKVGDKTFKKTDDYAGYKIAINENIVSDGNVCYVKTVTFYKLSKDKTTYIDCGTVTVNDYITFK